MTSPTPKDLNLYNNIKDKIFKEQPINSAYRSGRIVKEYKKAFLEKYNSTDAYLGKKIKGENLERWFRENWVSIGGKYPTYRPSIRINEKTPKTINEIDKKESIKQIALKQKFKDKKNLPKFI